MLLTLRQATTTDLPAIAALMNTAFRGTGPNASWNTEAAIIEGDRTSEAALQQELTDNPNATLLVTSKSPHSPIQGCVWLEPVSAHLWYLGSLTVDPALQNSGLGHELLASAERWAAERGARMLQMKVVNIRSTLIAWYERREYRLTGESQPFPYGDDRFGTALRDDLIFVVLEKALSEPENRN